MKIALNLFLSILSVLLTNNYIFSQIIKINNGINFSHLSSKNISILNKNISSYASTIGIDFCERKLYFLTGEIGYISVGGKEFNDGLAGEYRNIKEKFNYIHSNITFNVKTSFSNDNVHLFIGMGPYMNIHIGGNPSFKSNLYKDYNLRKLYLGGKLTGGLYKDINQFRIGVNANYLLDITKIAYSEYANIKSKSLLFNLSIGYKIN